MSQHLPPALIVAHCDRAAAQTLDLSCKLLVWDGEALLEGKPLKACTAQVLGALILSQEGQEQLSGLGEAWVAATGLRELPLKDLAGLSPSDQPEAAARALAAMLIPAFSALAAYNADLMGQLAKLRIAHESLAISARKRAQQVLSQSDGKRWLAQAHGPLSLDPQAAHILPPGTHLTQRLKIHSEGLSDIAIFLPEVPDEGQIVAKLRLGESGNVVGHWQISERDLSPGWLRLSLVTALDEDQQTATLEVSWHGHSPLRLGAGVYHPDPDLCAHINGATDQILAHRVWRFMAGCTPSLPVDGHYAAPVPQGARFYVDPSHLERALEGEPEAPCLKFYGALKALQVHPRPNALTAARLPSAVPPGITQIDATIGARAPFCPMIDYALAAVPRHPLHPLPDLLADAARAHRMSDWVSRSGDAMGEVTLILPEPFVQTHDLLLVTRVPPGKTAAHAWATFRDIRMVA
ncbi:DUF6212 domain-containing protein [Roseibaca sp. Y0-43]|uniref:DUF6212 domain-containing protein n=1 Tax=Roseibaca sp. Y0-43 TaxID=2816854 RepID=UPI001D0C7743|nr:DUF6212 domain-containing protein [Roseibaca sp. Y0-43]MCC1482861.1 hypothetical protein [Roseibaca sp. Y0-43]